MAYSTHSEISFLGEAGIGNEGGWTYPIKCKDPKCVEWHPGWHYTNNTGWVDFTITPTVGFLWMLAEDTLDRFVSDHFQGGDRFNLGLAFMRGALNPARTFANLMRFQLPWYRDFQHDPELENSLLVHPQPSDEQIAEAGRFRRFAIAPFYHTMPMGSPNQPCTMCFSQGGFGITFDYAITPWLAASFSSTSQPGLLQKGTTEIGSTTTFGSGLRFMHDGPINNISFVVRPTIVTSEIQMPLVLNVRHNTYMHPQVDNERAAVTLEFSNDYKLSKTVAIRTSDRRYDRPLQGPHRRPARHRQASIPQLALQRRIHQQKQLERRNRPRHPLLANSIRMGKSERQGGVPVDLPSWCECVDAGLNIGCSEYLPSGL